MDHLYKRRKIKKYSSSVEIWKSNFENWCYLSRVYFRRRGKSQKYAVKIEKRQFFIEILSKNLKFLFNFFFVWVHPRTHFACRDSYFPGLIEIIHEILFILNSSTKDSRFKKTFALIFFHFSYSSSGYKPILLGFW